MSKRWPYSSPGIPDNFFKRSPGVPMTKQEIRTLSISQLCIFPGAVIYDVGAGTGSVSVECALLGCEKVYSIEANEKAYDVILENIDRFGLDNVQAINGAAPGSMEALPGADRIFIGGSSGQLYSILEMASKKLKPGGKLVVNSITIDTGNEVLKFCEKEGFVDINIVTINVSRAISRGRVYMWQALNPVQIVSAQKRER